MPIIDTGKYYYVQCDQCGEPDTEGMQEKPQYTEDAGGDAEWRGWRWISNEELLCPGCFEEREQKQRESKE